MSLFLSIPGFSGDSLDKGHKSWFNVETFDFNVDTAPATKADFSPLRLTFSSDAALTKMMDYLTSGTTLDGMTLESTDPLSNKIYTLDLANAQITQIVDLPFGGFAVDIAYSQIDLETNFADEFGKLYSESQFNWDVTTNQPSGQFGPFTPGTGTTAVAAADQFFFLIDGQNGDSLDKTHKGWFEIANFNFDVSRPGDIASGFGAPQFNTITVEMSSDTGLTSLLNLAASGKFIKGARIEGVDFSDFGSSAVYDLTIGNIDIVNIMDSEDSGYFVTFRYDLVETKVFDSISSKFLVSSYDLTTQTPGVAMPTLAPSSTSSPTSTPSRYFLALSDVAGDGVFKGHEKWIEISAVNYNIDSSFGGKADFSPVNFVLSSETGFVPLFSGAASGKIFAGATIHGVNSLNQTIFELNLAEVIVSSINDFGAQGLGVELAYKQIEVGTKGTTPTGTLVTNPTFGWDLSTNSPVDVAPVAPSGSTGSVGSTDYFMLVHGMSGGATDKGHANWFNILDFNIDIDNSATPGGAGAGKSVFSDLTVVVESQAALTNLMLFAASGKIIQGIKIEGVSAAGGTSTPVYDLTAAGVQVTSISENTGLGYVVEFDFDQIKIDTNGLTTSGTKTPLSASWNLLTATNEVSIPTLTPASASSWAAGASDFFIAIDGFKGDSVNDKHKGWLDVDGFDLGITNSAGGKAQFSDLTVQFSSDAAFADFTKAVSEGAAHKLLTLHGTNSLGQLTYNIDLANAKIIDLFDPSGPGLQVKFAFSAIELTQFKFSNTGAYTGGEVFGWDLVANSPAKVDSAAPAGSLNFGSPNNYFMLVDNMNGASSDKAHGGWFDIDGFTFRVSNSAGGKAQYDGVDIVVSSDRGLTRFLEYAASGKVLPGIAIEGVGLDAKGVSAAVYDLVLGGVHVGNVSDTSGGGYLLHLTFDYLDIITKQSSGAVITDFKWDVTGAAPGGPPPELNPVGSARNDVLAGLFNNSVLFGLAGNDIISGMNGDDFIDGGSGNDRMFGGNGTDIVSYATATAGVTVNLLTTLDQDTKGAGLDSLSGFEELRGSAFGDRLTGNNLNNTLDGGDGGDILDGRLGIDTMRGGKGEDTYYVDNAGDVVADIAGEGNKDAIYSSVDFDLDLAPNVENLFAAATAIADLKLGGSAGDNYMRGSSFKDTLIGDAGNDLLNGGLEADLMIGGLGNDIFYVDHVSDIVQDGVGEGTTDTVYASVNFTLGAGQEIDYLNANAGPSGLTLTGNELTNRIRGSNGGNDVLSGGGAGDILYGQAGDDRLAGGLGVDSIYGGGGKDTFVLRNSSLDRDVLLDYVAVDDTLEVSAALFGGGLKVGVLAASQFLSNLDGNVANGGSVNTRFVYNSAAGLLYFDADGTGAAAKVLIAQLPSLPSLNFDDILVVT